jgi:hypothetical protein
MNSQQFADIMLQMVDSVSIKASRDQIKAVSDIYETLDGLASGDLTIVPTEQDPKGCTEQE